MGPDHAGPLRIHHTMKAEVAKSYFVTADGCILCDMESVYHHEKIKCTVGFY